MSLLSIYAPRYTPSIWDAFAPFEPILASSNSLSPRFEVLEDPEGKDQNGYTLTLDLPGYKREDVTVELTHGNILTVKASRAGRRGEKESLERSITLGEDIEAESISAKLEHGVLSVSIQRQGKAKPKQIRIE